MKYMLSEAEKSLLEQGLNRVLQKSRGSDMSLHELVEQSAAVIQGVLGPHELIRQEIENGLGFFLLRGCPIGDAQGEDPASAAAQSDKLGHSALLLLGMNRYLGFNPFSFMQEKSGALVHEVFPIASKSRSVSSNGLVEFRPHADGAYLPRHIRPETLSLICINNDSGTDTRLVNVDTIIRNMDMEEVHLLASSQFVHTPPETFEVSIETGKVTSVLDRVDGVWEVKVATHNSRAVSPQAEMALSRFAELAWDLAVPFSWTPGDLLVFSNRRCLHGRGDISGKRWLRRCYGSSRVQPCSVIDLASY